MKRSSLDANILKQAKVLIATNPFFKQHQDENVFIHWKQDLPFVLPHKMQPREAKSQGFETMVNTVKLSAILNGTARFGNR
jgi:hypothetical protein